MYLFSRFFTILIVRTFHSQALQRTFGNDTKSLEQCIGLALANYKNSGHEIPSVMPAICQNFNKNSFNFDLALNKKVIRIIDTEDGEKSNISYRIKIKIYFANGTIQSFEDEVGGEKVKNFAWINCATNGLAKSPKEKAEKIEFEQMIQLCIESQDAPTEIIYPNSGWRFIRDFGWCYVYGLGAIGIQGNLIHTARGDEEFVFPPHSFIQAEVFKAALNMIKICKKGYASTVLFLFTHAATIATFFEEVGFSINFVLGIVGVTNSRKTSLVIELTRIFHQSKKMADAEFTSTACGIEKVLSKFKDAPIFIDDFYPGETRAEQLSQNKKLEKLVRFYGNRVPKKRMDDYSAMSEKFFPIQGVCVMTMELIAGVQSSLSRMMIVEIDKKEVQNSVLAYYQKNGWILSTHMFDFISWEAENQKKIMKKISSQMPDLRTQYLFEFQRFGEMYAVFHLVSNLISDYGQSRGFWTYNEAVAFVKECDYIVISVLKSMEEKFKNTDKGMLTLYALCEVIERKKIQLISLNTETCKMKEEAYQDEKRIFIQTRLLKKLVIEYCTYYKIEAFFISEDEIISALERLGVLEINEKCKKRERARKLPFQRGNRLRYLYIIKDFLQNKVDEN